MAGGLSIALLLCGVSGAQEQAVPRTPDRRPDLSGIWRSASNRYLTDLSGGSAQLVFQPWARALYQYRTGRTDLYPPLVRCKPSAGPGFFNAPGFEIVDVGLQRQLSVIIGDLTVVEPTGSVCSATMKRTSGGGVLKADIIEQADDNRKEIYTAASAFGGAYKVSVKSAFGRAIGNSAVIKVTRFQGTRRKVHVMPIEAPSTN